jgi:hypothetical protein
MKQIIFKIYPQPVEMHELGDEEYDGPAQYFVDSSGHLRTPARYGSWAVPCPYGEVGDVFGGKNILAIRCQRLHAITEAEAISLGVEAVMVPTRNTVPARKWKNYLGRRYCEGINLNSAVESYKTLWDEMYGVGSFDENPCVWVLDVANA